MVRLLAAPFLGFGAMRSSSFLKRKCFFGAGAADDVRAFFVFMACSF
jgi:hypothetical protein